MGLLISTVGSDSGLLWETNLNASLSSIDTHDHSSGKGVQISPAGLNISSDLSLQSNSATNVKSVVFSDQISLSTVNSLYTKSGELWYNDPTSPVQITSGGSVNATSSGISSGGATASFVSSVLVVNQAASTPANVQCGSLLIGNNVASSNFVTLQPTNSLASNYSLTLPAIPASTSFLTVDTSGNMSASVATNLGIVAGNIANATITGSKIASATITGSNIASATITGSNLVSATVTGTQIANSTIAVPNMGAFGIAASATVTTNITSTTSAHVGSLTVLPNTGTIPLPARPVFIFFQGGYIGLNGAGGETATLIIYAILNNIGAKTAIATFTLTATGTSIPCGCLNTSDLSLAASVYTGAGGGYQLWASVSAVTATLVFSNVGMSCAQI